MNRSRTVTLRNILTKYSLFKRALNRFQNREITLKKFIRWTNEVIKSKDKSFLSLPVCEHLFGTYFTELYTKIQQIQKLTEYSQTFCTFHFYRLRKHILKDEILTNKYADTMIFLLLLNQKELSIMGFNLITVYK